MNLNSKIISVILAVSWITPQEIPSEIQELIQSAGMNQNDAKKLLENQNLDEVVPGVSEQKLKNDRFFDSSEEIKQLIDNEISVNDNDNNIENNVEENNDEIKKTNNDLLNGTKREGVDRLSSHFGYSTFFNDPEIFQNPQIFLFRLVTSLVRVMKL